MCGTFDNKADVAGADVSNENAAGVDDGDGVKLLLADQLEGRDGVVCRGDGDDGRGSNAELSDRFVDDVGELVEV